MNDAKDLYCERSISFLDYFFKRLDIYNACQMPTFIKYYRGVDLEKYKDKIRLITDEYPYQNERGEFKVRVLAGPPFFYLIMNSSKDLKR